MTFSPNISTKPTNTVAYLRVSTNSQDLEKNKADILSLANDKKLGNVVFVEETISGKVSWRKRLIAEVIESAEKGDNILVSELSRLGRSMLEIMEILSVCTQKQVNVYSVKGNWNLDGTIQSKLIAMCFSMASEIERDLVSSRTKEALKALKASGKTLGRPKGIGKSKLDPFKAEIEALLANGSTQRFIAKKYSVTPVTVSLWVSKHRAVA